MKIGFDIDGTITSPDNLVPLIRQYFKNDFKYEDLKYYDVDKVLGISKEEVIEFFKTHHDGIILNPKMMEGAVDLINKLSEDNEIYLITARQESTLDDTLKWIKKEGIKINRDNVHFVGSHNKENLIKDLNLDVYIDDRLETLVEVDKIYSCKLILIDAPYNQFKVNINYKRVCSYSEISDYIKQLENEIK